MGWWDVFFVEAKNGMEWWNERKNERKKKRVESNPYFSLWCRQRQRQRTQQNKQRRQHDPEHLSFPFLPFVLPTSTTREQWQWMDGWVNKGFRVACPQKGKKWCSLTLSLSLSLFTLTQTIASMVYNGLVFFPFLPQALLFLVNCQRLL